MSLTMLIKKLKERIKSLSGNMDKDKIKEDLEEIETINIELDYRVTKLIAENEHLKQTYKQLYDSIKPARVRSKEQCPDLTNQECYDIKGFLLEGLGHNLFSVGQFRDSNLEVAFRQHTCFIHNLEGVDLLTGSRGNNLYTLSLGDMMASSPICLLSKASKTKSWLWHRRLSYLNFGVINHLARHGIVRGLPKLKFEKDHLCSACAMAARTMLTYAKASLSQWAEVVATTCYTQNRSIIRLRYGKTPYELLHDKLPNLSFFHVFGALCYLTNDSENLGKLQPKTDIDFDELTTMASEHSSLGPALHEMTPATISSELVPNPPPSTPFVPPSRTDWDMLFQPLFDELLNPSPSVDHPTPKVVAPIDEVAAPVPAVSTDSPFSTTVDQDAPSPSKSQTTPDTQPPVIPNDVEEDNHDIEVAHMGNDPYFGIPILEVPFD
ncbi:integrase, catalytic region, zinc finger, CCHC-type containing protein [Tanacetum coccineum]|uniref:Integrase, catalytic region, zinc finger, CCHC-type containing protein n=1 Tax=Tanacetum coccineum TaxID=301880 RepID=A0ABQ5AJM7_9ASTR